MSEGEEISDYVCLYQCFSRPLASGNETDGQIITTDITRIEVFKTDSQLLHTPPGMLLSEVVLGRRACMSIIEGDEFISDNPFVGVG